MSIKLRMLAAAPALVASSAGLHAIDPLEYTCAEFKPNLNGGHNEAEYGSGVARRHCRWSGVECMELFYSDATGPVLRAPAEARLTPQVPRYPFFVGQWILLLFVMSILLAYLYAWSRPPLAPDRRQPSKSA